MNSNKPHTNIVMRRLVMSLLTCLLVALQACQFDSDADNFVELQKPDDELMILIDVAQLNPDEIIYARTNSQFFFRTTAEGKELLDIQFFLDGNPLHYDPYFEVAYLEQREVDNKIHDLTVLVAFSTGTGSLAERAGLEAYVGEHNFKLKFIDDDARLNLRQLVNQDGHLVLEWDQPKEYDIMHYKVYNKQSGPAGGQIAHISNPHETQITIPSYAYGTAHYSVAAFINNSYALFIEEEIEVTSEPITQEHFTINRIANDKIHITWENPNPYPAQYLLELDDGTTIHVSDSQQGATIPVGIFPSTNNLVFLHVFSESINPADYDFSTNYDKVVLYADDPTIYSAAYAFDSKNNMIHHFTYFDIESYQLPHIKLIQTTKINNSIGYTDIVRINDKGTIALTHYDNGNNVIKVYKDYKCAEPPLFSVTEFTDDIQLTNNNLLLLDHSYGSTIDIYDLKSKQKIITKTWKSPHSDGHMAIHSHLSLDGTQLLVRCIDTSDKAEHYQWIEHYKINSDGLLLINKLATDNVLRITTNPHNGDIVMYHHNPYKLEQKIVIANPLDNIIHTIEKSLIGVDAITGNLAYLDYSIGSNNVGSNEIVVVDNSYKQELLRMPVSTSPHSSSIFDNIIEFSNSYINIEPLIQ